MLSTNNLPDAFYQMIFTPTQLYEQSQNGNLVPLDDLIDKYAPNIKKMLQDDPSIKKAVTMPDGKIYSLPYVENSVLDRSVRFYLNTEMLNTLGLSMPKTLSDLEQYLLAFKAKKPDAYPVAFPKGNEGIFIDALSGAFGLGNCGIQGEAANIDLGPDGKVRFYKTDDKYKDMLTLLNKWYQQGLINPEGFSGLDSA